MSRLFPLSTPALDPSLNLLFPSCLLGHLTFFLSSLFRPKTDLTPLPPFPKAPLTQDVSSNFTKVWSKIIASVTQSAIGDAW